MIFFLLLYACFPHKAVAQQPGEQRYEDVSVMPGGVKGKRIQAVIDAVNATVGHRPLLSLVIPAGSE